MDTFEIRTAERTARIDAVITSHARTIFAEQDDVFFWDDEHTFQLWEHENERWNGRTLFRNYLIPSALIKTIDLPMEDLVRICDLLEEKRRPSEILQDPSLSTKDEKRVESTVRLLHIYGLVQCFRSAV